MPPRLSLRRLTKMLRMPLVDLLTSVHASAMIPLTEAELQAIVEAASDESDLPTNPVQHSDWPHGEPVAVVDLLEADEHMKTDLMPPIQRALSRNPEGLLMLVMHKWEPELLYDIWSRTGVEH